MKQADTIRHDAELVAIATEPPASATRWRRIPLPDARGEGYSTGALQRRNDARTAASLPVGVTSIDASRDPATGQTYFAISPDERTENLSRRGLCVRCERPPAVGTRILLQVRLPGEASIDVIGQTRWTRIEFEPGQHGARAFARVGIELLGGAPRALERYDRALGRLESFSTPNESAVASPEGRR
jgi:hypothetical protein